MSAIAILILWSHALAALLFAGVALSRLHHAGTALPRQTFVIALAMTALWSLAVAGIGPDGAVTHITESLRNLAWLSFMYALVRSDRAGPERRAVSIVYGVVAVIVAGGAMLALAEERYGGALARDLATVRVIWRMMVAIGALVLVHHLYLAVAPRTRGGIRLALLALAGLWGVDFLLYLTAYAFPAQEMALIVTRGIVLVLAAPVFAVALQRAGDWTLQLSRTVAWQTLSIVVALVYVVGMLLATSAIASLGGVNARLWQTAFVFGSTAAGLVILSSPWLRAWAKVKVSKHFFRHRYDYRAEWARFTDTLGKPDGVESLDRRIVKAVADLTDSPAGLLLVPDGEGLGIGAGWNWDAATGTADARLVTYLTRSGRIVELDTVRADAAAPAEAASVPVWMLDCDAWAVVPLPHLDRLQGAIVLARPPLDRALDWEDFDLLRIAGRHVASYLAEARAQEALAEAQRFDEFNRRFAFILHDIKNLVSQLTLVARNAERHADNPAFRADMVATLHESSARMNDLLARLSQQHRARPEDPRTLDVLPLAEQVARGKRAQHPVVVFGTACFVQADPARLEQVLNHLVQNAIDASPPTEPVTIAITASGDSVALAVVDRGCGMSPAFIRDQLFKPFVSTKPGGFGIGAFEARHLAEAMRGSVAVESQLGEGTTFHLTLPAAHAQTLEHAA